MSAAAAVPTARRRRLAAALVPLELASVWSIDDDSAEHAGHAGAAAGGGHFSLMIVSEQFAGLSRLARHRAVLDRVGDLIPHPGACARDPRLHARRISHPDERMSRNEPEPRLRSPCWPRSPSPVTAQAQPAARQGRTRPPRPPPRPPPPPDGKALYPQAQFDFMLKERMAQGQPDTPELRNAVREELNTRELLVREAKKKDLDKNADIKTADGPRRADRAGPRLRRPTGSRRTRFPKPTCAKEYDADQVADRRQGIQGRAHPGREGRRGEGRDRRAAEGRQVRRAREGALEGPGLARTAAATSTGTRPAAS